MTILFQLLVFLLISIPISKESLFQFITHSLKKTFKFLSAAAHLKLVHLLQEKLFSSKNRTEASLGKKLKIDMLPEIEKDHKVLKASCGIEPSEFESLSS